jgi:hypothetical protein
VKRLSLLVLVAYLAALMLAINPASADTQLLGYTAEADASVVRVEVFDPSIPIPASPEGDVSLVYARSNVSTGPSTRALATYLWPGDALGDGLGTLAGNPALDYPVKVNSRFPATASAPATNRAQLNDASGLTTSTDGYTTQATAIGVGVGGNSLSGIGAGLCGILPAGTCPSGAVPSTPTLPLPTALTGLLSVANGKAQGGATLVSNSITALATAKASNISILGGIVNVDGLVSSSQTTSNGTTATTVKTLRIGGLSVAGTAVNLTDQANASGSVPGVPNKPIDIPQLGLTVKYLQSKSTVSGATGSVSTQGLLVTIDVAKLNQTLHLGALGTPLGAALAQIPSLGPLLQGLLKFGTKLVIVIGDTNTSATSAPPYNGGGTGGLPGGSGGGGGTGGSSSPGTFTGGTGGTSTGVPTGGTVGPAGGTTGVTTPGSGTSQPAAFTLPGLGQTPSVLILAILGLVGLFGWLFRLFGGYMLGGTACAAGLRVGVPNLRKV